MPVLTSQNLVESCIFLNENHAERPFQHFITKFFSHSLSCKLQLIDLIMVSAACLAGWQTVNPSIFFPENSGFAGKEKKQMDGKLKTQLDAF